MNSSVTMFSSSNVLLTIISNSNQFSGFINKYANIANRPKAMKPMHFVVYAIAAIILMMLSSCSNKSAEDIEKEISSGVVLIQNKSFYEIKLPNGESLFFTDYDEENGIQGLVADVDSVEMIVSYGTGFFVSDDGKIATNHHVVADNTEEKDITRSLSDIVDALKSAISDIGDEMYREYQNAVDLTEIALYDSDISSEEYQDIKIYRDELYSELESYQEYFDALSSLKPENSEIIYHNELSIAYNDTYVTKDSDLQPCIIRKSDKDNDLAIIQLKDKKTPQGKYVFNIQDKDPLEEYELWENIEKSINGDNDKNAKIYMPAFNLGPSLAITDEGLKLQFGSGTISQQNTDNLMYTIPSLPGSSGSPVVNQKGEVIAINSSRIKSSDSFNSGIRVKYLSKLLREL